MAQVVATAESVVRAPADVVRTALADYAGVRAWAAPEQYDDYEVLAGGAGDGTRVRWRLQATEKRVREQDIVVSALPDGGLVESDQNSSMVSTWTVHPADAGVTTVRVRTTWKGAGGIGGIFERIFAPRGLARIQVQWMANLERELTTG